MPQVSQKMFFAAKLIYYRRHHATKTSWVAFHNRSFWARVCA